MIRSINAGLSVLELIVVMLIVSVALSLALPAIQSAREAARRTECASHLKQIGLACLTHEQAHSHLPTGGWGWKWHGDPDRGFGRRQPGGWIYNILPFVEQSALRERGASSPEHIKRVEGMHVAETAIGLFSCPSRRTAYALPFVDRHDFVNIVRPSVMGRSDYSACAGDLPVTVYGPGPVSLTDGDDSAYRWEQLDRTGVVFRRSEIRIAEVRDGSSVTYLAGEGYLCPDFYFSGLAANDNQGMYTGYDRDTLRTTHDTSPPLRDQPAIDSDHSFGSNHPNTFQMVFCDGSVRGVAYGVSLDVHRRLGNRSDGLSSVGYW